MHIILYLGVGERSCQIPDNTENTAKRKMEFNEPKLEQFLQHLSINTLFVVAVNKS